MTQLSTVSVLAALAIVCAGASPVVARPDAIRFTDSWSTGDANGDGSVDFVDLNRVLEHFGKAGEVTVFEGDFVRDGVIDFEDFNMVLQHMGSVVPPVLAVPGVNCETSMFDLQPTTVDLETGRTIIAPNKRRVWLAEPGPLNPPIVPAVELVPTTDGFDLVFTYVNATQSYGSLGNIYVPGIRFDRHARTFDFSYDTRSVPIDHGDADYTCCNEKWPGSTYSPVVVLGEDPAWHIEPYTLSASLHYPVLKYKHAVAMRIESPGGQFLQGGRNWQIRFQLNTSTSSTYNPEGDIAPGETRRYVLAVRLHRSTRGQHENDWLRTLASYRQYFRWLYGPVRYERDPRPVRGVKTADYSDLSDNNPYGFTSVTRRLDVFGWTRWIEKLELEETQGWNRWMIWTPTGLFRNNQHNNFPFQFTSEWANQPVIPPTVPELADFASTRTVGLWWGRSSQVMYDWDTEHFEVLNPANDVHVGEADHELEGASQTGAIEIGLDKFGQIPEWDAYFWIQRMRREFPQFRFIIEPSADDFLHTLAPTFMPWTREPKEWDLWLETTPTIADFLNPGHEMWGRILISDIRDLYGLPFTEQPTPEMIYPVMNDVITNGFIVCIIDDLPLIEPFIAVESWTFTVPPDLQP